MADVLTGASAFRFKDLDLSGNLVSWNDKIGLRLAVHQYLKRDGAEVEHMGAEPGRFTMRLCFLGSQWAPQYRAFVASIRQDPKGQMVHPLLGTLRVACEGISDAAVAPATERDSINLVASFVEDAVDTTITSATAGGPAAQQGKVTALAAQVTGAVSKIVSAVSGAIVLADAALSLAALAASDAAAALSDSATTFAGDAVDAASSNTPDPSLDQQLAAIVTDAASAIAAVQALSPAVSDATSYDAVSRIEQLAAACLALADAVAASKPTIVEYVVPGTTDVATLAAKLYGEDAFDRLDEILTLNRIADPHAIPAGTVLRVASPTL